MTASAVRLRQSVRRIGTMSGTAHRGTSSGHGLCSLRRRLVLGSRGRGLLGRTAAGLLRGALCASLHHLWAFDGALAPACDAFTHGLLLTPVAVVAEDVVEGGALYVCDVHFLQISAHRDPERLKLDLVCGGAFVDDVAGDRER